nr:MAG TPA: hypothetical protein [Caudoviricetes sp.]
MCAWHRLCSNYANDTGSIDGNDLTSTIPLQSIYSMSHCTC